MLIDGHNDVVHRQVEFLCRRLDDAQVGLVRHQPVDITLVEAVTVQRLACDRPQCRNRASKDRIAVHMDVSFFRTHRAVFERVLSES